MDSNVVVFGVPDLTKQLLAYAIQREVGIPCSFVGSGDAFDGVPIGGNAGQKTLVLVDFADAGLEGALAQLKVRSRVSDGFVVALYNVAPAADVERVVTLRGIQGLFHIHDPIELLVKGVRALLDGEVWLPRRVLVQIALRAGAAPHGNGEESTCLTRREVEILLCVGAGHTNDEISRKLCVSSHTVKTHLYRVFKKIKVRNRMEAFRWASSHLGRQEENPRHETAG